MRRLRIFLRILSALYLVIVVGSAAEIAIIYRQSLEFEIPVQSSVRLLFALFVSVSFNHIAGTVRSMDRRRRSVTKVIMHVYLAGSAIFAIAAWYLGSSPSVAGVLVPLCIYLFVVSAIDRVPLRIRQTEVSSAERKTLIDEQIRRSILDL